MEDLPRIKRFKEVPSARDFEHLIESTNIPAVFNGCINHWEATFKWNPSNGGLDYLQERVGSSVVEAMLSRTAPVFYGDLRSHERVPLPFSAFIDFCKQSMQNVDGCCDSLESFNVSLPDAAAPKQIYLAQVPILNIENEERVQLETLREDIQTPAFLEEKVIVSTNLWMNNGQSRSSTHYDPHHNLLCIVSGCKQVILWPPSASPMLYPMPIYGEASNHSSVPLENQNISLYPRAEGLMEFSQKVILHAGDALFIPEGWFHQVDSDDLTIAVNFWWQSGLISSMSDHMDSYYLRRILKRLTDKEMNEVLPKASFTNKGNIKGHTCEKLDKGGSDHRIGNLDNSCERNDSERKQPASKYVLRELEPSAITSLHELVSIVHDHVNVAVHDQPTISTSNDDSTARVKDECRRTVTAKSFSLEGDPVAKTLWTLEPCTLYKVLLAMALRQTMHSSTAGHLNVEGIDLFAQNFPRTLEALILHLLSPVGAEVLTRKFDEMDEQITEEDRNRFYEAFYSAFDDQSAAMDAILNGKESFASLAFRNVLDKYLGVSLKWPIG